MSTAKLGYGTTFAIESDDSPGDYTELDEVVSVTPPSDDVDQVEVTHMQSPGRRREYIGGLIDSGECSVEMNFIPGNASDVRLNHLLALPVGTDRVRSCRITFPNSVYWTFDAEVTGYEKSVPLDDKMTATVTFKVTGIIDHSVTG